ncbi:hypothetical protein C9374_000197 [Naegleria lovaniensis]|uniref:DnaJ-like protein C11 C-terminal domain-containing protein n=1 Tax=Naegleria lovaniensis TaxID=51637 RepID=A0AA88GYK6_NAELO|nr:uncharacterized protein C9374_000197 [Naegleria lovaniensis]KAG2388758.1 hypothetical protein C9374_000197 [Naegleria lovaniensis]
MTIVAILGVVALFFYLYKAFFTSWNKTFDYSEDDKEFWDQRISEAICYGVTPNPRALSTMKPSSEKVFKELGSAWSEDDRIRFIENKKQVQLKQKKLDGLYQTTKHREKQKDGLIIINARYGVFNPEFRALLDVTVPLQCFVSSKSSTITIQKEDLSMSDLPGFGNPLEGFNNIQHLKKELQVIYRTNGSLKMSTFVENDHGFEVRLP